jgi:hypothetical protein
VTRLDSGAIVDDVRLDDGDDEVVLPVRFERCVAGWQASFELTDPRVEDLSVVHRLVDPSLGAARVAVPQAVAYLLGCPVDAPLT